MKKYLKIFLGTMFAVFLTAASSWAISFDLDIDLATGDLGTGPYGQVTLTQDGNGVEFEVELFNDFQFVRTGAGDEFDFLFTSTDLINFTQFTSYEPLDLIFDYSDPADFVDNAKGPYRYGVYIDGQGNGAGDAYDGILRFLVQESTIADFIDVDEDVKYLFAADVYGNGITGLVAAGTSPVPEPATLLLLGTGLLGVGIVTKRKMKN